MTVVSDSAPVVLREYYGILTGGIESYGDGRDLAPLLAEDLHFEGPIAGQRTGAAPFLQGVRGFIANIQKIDLIQEVHDPDGAAVCYDAHLPKGTSRLTEFFTFAEGKIQRLCILYDPADYLAKGGA
ncbi:nuclear transport factor 2 family protein [Amycolatopsis sp. NBC_01488]|uniref:nuclear transport factor 2 family protein n=1 Tax=Amycolatopsis sp. NBC_01488 TaxID=2903563 RepID=UPI002E288BC9|nr:nuclear transport factor 2 family protein [Amycolatopsis sp. NBC_01488]